MTTIITRAQWGAMAPRSNGNTISPAPKGFAVHWEGPKMGAKPHALCDDTVRSIQAFHQNSRGWADIAYNFLVCPHGSIYEGRGIGKGSAANGTTAGNLDYYAVCAITGDGDTIQPAMVTGIQVTGDYLRSKGVGPVVLGHRDLFNTACPGNDLYADVHHGLFGQHGQPAVQVSANAPISHIALPAVHHTATATAQAPLFPLPAGWYFGPKTGPAQSVSGYFSHGTDLAHWQQRMKDRGWAITVDGRYGNNTAAVALDFQAQVGLHPDRLIGAQTWSAAWTAKVT